MRLQIAGLELSLSLGGEANSRDRNLCSIKANCQKAERGGSCIFLSHCKAVIFRPKRLLLLGQSKVLRCSADRVECDGCSSWRGMVGLEGLALTHVSRKHNQYEIKGIDKPSSVFQAAILHARVLKVGW